MHEVPFTVDLYGGFGKCHGLLKDDGDHLVLEYQIEDTIASVLKSKVTSVRIPTDKLLSVELTKGWFGARWLGTKIVIQATSLDAVKDVPGMNNGRLDLSIAPRDVENAELFLTSFYDTE